MSRTPQKVRKIEELFHRFIDVVDSVEVDRQTAIDALEYTLADLVLEVVESEEQLTSYLNGLRDRTLSTWTRRLRKACQ